MASDALAPDVGCYVAIHQFSNVPEADRHYCQPHVHEYDELNIFHTNDSLRVAVQLDDETIHVEAPATVVIPAGTRHATNVSSGTGFMVAVLFDGAFRATNGTG
jgi:quercetin dioxygenase-like cupin family protein